MKKFDIRYARSLLHLVKDHSIVFWPSYVRGHIPLVVGSTKTILNTDMPDKLCADCPCAAHGHVLRRIGPHTYEKLCPIPFLRDGKIDAKEFFSNGGCGVLPNDYHRAKKMFLTKKPKPKTFQLAA